VPTVRARNILKNVSEKTGCFRVFIRDSIGILRLEAADHQDKWHESIQQVERKNTAGNQIKLRPCKQGGPAGRDAIRAILFKGYSVGVIQRLKIES